MVASIGAGMDLFRYFTQRFNTRGANYHPFGAGAVEVDAEFGWKKSGVNHGPLQIRVLAVPVDWIIVAAQKLALIGHHGFLVT